MDQDDRLIKLLSLLASDMQTIQNSMQAIQKDMRSLHAYTESTDAEVRKLRSDFNASVGNIRELTGRLEIVENQIAENTEALRKSGLDTESLKTDIGEIIASTDQSRDTLDGSSRDIRAAADHIVKVGGEVLVIQQNMEKLSEADEGIATSLNILRQDLESVRGELQATTLDTFSIKEQLEKIISDTGAARIEMEEHSGSLRSIDEKVTSYDRNFFEIMEEVKKNRESLPSVDQHLQELGTSLSNMISDIEDIDTDIDKHASRTELSIEILNELKAGSDAFSAAMRSL